MDDGIDSGYKKEQKYENDDRCSKPLTGWKSGASSEKPV
jgi:hypothetical protein